MGMRKCYFLAFDKDGKTRNSALSYINLENYRRQHIAKNGLKPPIFRSVVGGIFRA